MPHEGVAATNADSRQSVATEQQSLIEELDDAIANGNQQRRTELLERITDLFLYGSTNYSDDQTTLFDDVLCRLVATIEVSARRTLALRLSRIPRAPPSISRALAFDDAVSVAGPMLQWSELLDNAVLVENARTKSQAHLLAISRRRRLDEIVTDILVERGDRPVVMSTAQNPGAKFSECGFATLVRRSEGDDDLAGCVGSRPDIPRHHLLKLLAQASDSVRRRLEAADPLSCTAIKGAVFEAASAIRNETAALSRDYLAAQTHIQTLCSANQLGEAELSAFATAGKFEETTVALAVLCDLPTTMVELAMIQDRPETLLILARAIEISWPTAKAILRMRPGGHAIPCQELERCLGLFSRLKPATARQVIEFQRKRHQAQ
jgi:uncharacterized protein (DUF2336 family)